MYSTLAAEHALLQQELTRALAKIERLKHDALLSIAIVVYACPNHEITVSQDDMLQSYQLKQDLHPDSKTVTFKARKV